MITLADLASCPRWVGWRTKLVKGRPTKVPYAPRTGSRASSTDATTWGTRDEARWWAAKKHADGIDLVLGPTGDGMGLAGIDLDTCRDASTGLIAPWAKKIVDRFSTYGEVSPSGGGAKLFFVLPQEDHPAIDSLFEGNGGKVFRNGGGEHGPAIEVYRSGRYFTVTDESIGQTDLRQVSLADLEWLIREEGPRFAHKEGQKNGSSGNDQSRSGKAFRKGAALKAAGYSYAAMRDALLADADHEIVEWARTKGLANNERELHRIYENAGDNGAAAQARVIDTKAPFATAKLFLENYASGGARTLNHHRGAFYAWNGRAYLERADGELRSEIYPFLDQSFSADSKGNLYPVKPNTAMVMNILDGLRAAAHLDGSIPAPAWLRPVSKLPGRGNRRMREWPPASAIRQDHRQYTRVFYL